MPNDSGGFDGGRGGTRTHYPRLRRPVLYPDELRAQMYDHVPLPRHTRADSVPNCGSRRQPPRG
jgi:hypothetical protein